MLENLGIDLKEIILKYRKSSSTNIFFIMLLMITIGSNLNIPNKRKMVSFISCSLLQNFG